MYLISIIIPVFNVENTIQNSFESILNQSIGFENLEVIFIDDKSTDNSANIIKSFSDKYENVKSIFLDENSGFAGKPRNIGIKNATANYLMFLDPDDIYLENACNTLYTEIIENDLDLVSGNYNINRDNKIVKNNWNIIKLKDNESMEVESIEEYFNFLLTTPSVWAKIFKKEFILNENLEFLVGVPAQDLVFVSEALLKANGIKFINTSIVEYVPRQNGNEKSVTAKKDKSTLIGFLKSYTELYNIAKEYKEDYKWIGPRNLFFWIKQFVFSELPLKDKIDLLHIANPLFEEFIKSDKIQTPDFLNEFLKLISEKDFLNASKVSKYLDIYYDENIILENIKKKNIFLLFYGLDIEIGGLAKATFNRANLLKQHGYNVSLLNLNKNKNFEYITQYFHENGQLQEDIKITNIIEHYALKNTLNNKNQQTPENFEQYSIETIKTKDNAHIINYYILHEKLVKSKYFFKNYYCIKTFDEKNQINFEKYFTNDNFNYLTIKHEPHKKIITLHNQQTKSKIIFNNITEFHDYFITEILLNCKEKPFLINENSGAIPNFNNIDSNLAYKIASIHTNPYNGEHHYGSPIRDDFFILEDVSKIDHIIVLTEGLKKDLIKEFNVSNISAIPNILNLSEYSNEIPYEKYDNKISIFARLSPEKNIQDAIKAFKIVTEKRNDAILEIYGRAVTPSELIEEEKLKTLVNELNLEKNVIFKGHIENVNEEMAKSLATIFVSKFEGLGMVVLESMLNSTPVISYDIHYGPSDFIINGKNGYLIKQNDIECLSKCILNILNKPINSKKMGKYAHEHILTQINEETLFLKWENVLKQIYINSQREKMKIKDLIDPNISNKLKKLEKEKISLYRSNEKLYKRNRILKKQVNNNEGNIKKIFKKIKGG